MTTFRSDKNITDLVRELCKLSTETEWVEFKVNVDEPKEIGEYISALANSAALLGKEFAYIVWGVSDNDHSVVGTNFDPRSTKSGNEELENWLLRLLEPRINFCFSKALVDGVSVVVLKIDRASHQPVKFKGKEYIRVGSYKKKLRDFPEKERALWRVFEQTPFGRRILFEQVHDDEVLRLFDYPAYFELLNRSLPENRKGILEALAQDNLIHKSDSGGWDVTSLGLLLFAKDMENINNLRRKSVRVIQYCGNSRVKTLREQVFAKGYASGFKSLIQFINNLLPSNEVIETAIRKTVLRFPELAIRELVANALIHQDFFITGAGPMIEIFEDRLEITNPGAPLVDTQRFVDSPPRSRNESLASLMRRTGICEERGSGWDKIVLQSELYQLPAPLVEVVGDNTRVILFARRPLSSMNKRESACDVFSCLFAICEP